MAHAQVRDVPRTTSAPARAPQPSPLPAAAADPQQHPLTPPAFRAVLGHRYCGRLLIGSVTGRLSLGMVPVALILTAQADGHSLARAGVLAALYGIAPALGLPLLGRLADLRGLLLPCCWVKPPGVVHGRWSRTPKLTIRRRSQRCVAMARRSSQAWTLSRCALR
ncbi:hypothetical protein ACIQPS_34740 [Streptomyces sp. NPDC091290]|uniref:hypothetical protein n=1 Tax=Streptomyces sp. NPDC091290 TaxID=3365990 RepID=UPI0038129803